MTEQSLSVLCWQRSREPYRGAWAVPSGPVAPGETLGACVARQLASRVDIAEIAHLEQLETRSDPDRDPSQRTIATAYLGVVPVTADPQLPESAAWLTPAALPPMAFDHASVDRLRSRPAAQQVVLQQSRLRAGAGRVHDRPAHRDLLHRARSRHLADQPAAGASAPRPTRADRRDRAIQQRRRPTGRALPIQPPTARDHRSVRRATARRSSDVIRPADAFGGAKQQRRLACGGSCPRVPTPGFRNVAIPALLIRLPLTPDCRTMSEARAAGKAAPAARNEAAPAARQMRASRNPGARRRMTRAIVRDSARPRGERRLPRRRSDGRLGPGSAANAIVSRDYRPRTNAAR